MPKLLRKQSRLLTVVSIALLSYVGLTRSAYAQFGQAQTADKDLKLAVDSPYRDPNIIYLEADKLTNDDAAQILTAQGGVEGRYQDKTLRADRVVYNLFTGQVIAEGNVVLVQADGSSQFADKLELSNELEAGTATDFVARLPGGGVTAARFAARGENGAVELYNAYYTACKVCEEKPNPSWRIKARQVTQDSAARTVQYRDATVELFGVPVFYSPYLAHPDPSAERASGILTPFVGYSKTRGLNTRVPYYWAIDDYTEATITSRIYSKVNPLLGYDLSRQFHTGRLEVEGSLTYGSIFDKDGMAFDDASLFTDPDNAPVGKELRAHIFTKGLFVPTNFWTYGFGLQYTSDDNYLRRYNLGNPDITYGLFRGGSGRNTSQAFVVGLDDKTRFTASAVMFQDRRGRINELPNGQFSFFETDDGLLPLIAPRIEAEHYLTDPVFSGRLKAAGNLTVLTRDNGSDYARATASLDYGKTMIAPGGVEIKPFGNIRTDFYKIDADTDILPDTDANTFDRTLGQVGVDIRYPLVNLGEKVTWVLEPRLQLTHSIGDAKLDEFVESGATDIIVSEDAGSADLSAALLWQSNKASGFDFWQDGTRLDIGGSLNAAWGQQSAVNIFLGQSFASGSSGDIIDGLSSDDGGFLLGSGLGGDQSDIIGEVSLKLGPILSSQTKIRFNKDANQLSRIDSQAQLNTKWVQGNVRYFRLDRPTNDLVGTLDAPPESITGTVRLRVTKNWSTSYTSTRDLDRDVTQYQGMSIRYRDDCTLLELLYTKQFFNNDAIRDNSSIGFRISLLSLGDLGG